MRHHYRLLRLQRQFIQNGLEMHLPFSDFNETNLKKCLKSSDYLITTKNFDSLLAFDYAQNFNVKIISGLDDRVFDKDIDNK